MKSISVLILNPLARYEHILILMLENFIDSEMMTLLNKTNKCKNLKFQLKFVKTYKPKQSFSCQIRSGLLKVDIFADCTF